MRIMNSTSLKRILRLCPNRSLSTRPSNSSKLSPISVPWRQSSDAHLLTAMATTPTPRAFSSMTKEADARAQARDDHILEFKTEDTDTEMSSNKKVNKEKKVIPLKNVSYICLYNNVLIIWSTYNKRRFVLICSSSFSS